MLLIFLIWLLLAEKMLCDWSDKGNNAYWSCLLADIEALITPNVNYV